MNELEALKTIKIKCHPNSNPSPLIDECLGVIEKALLELQAIKEAKPSEALECLGALIKETKYDIDHKNNTGYSVETQERYTTYLNDRMIMLNTIKQALLKIEKLEKAWEVIKEHLAFEDRGIETYANKTKYIVRLESKDTGATIHIHLDTQQELELIEEMSK